MSFDPLISVIIPCYNHQEFIEETVNSVMKSNHSEIEIIVVNDGSTDNSEQVITSLQQRYSNLRYYYQQNAGPAAARNQGIKMAKGKYILPLDADDLISTEYIKEALQLLENDSTIKLVYCEAEFFGEKKGKWHLKTFSHESLAKDNMIFCSAIYRKADWKKVGGYDERMTWGWEDWEFWISLLKNGGKVKKLPFVGFKYRIRKKSRRKSTNKDSKRKTIQLINSKHSEFVYEHLNGPLHYQRSLSKFYNFFRFKSR